MLYDDIFERPISDYSDDEIRERALALRSKAKLTKKKAAAKKTTSKSRTAKTPAKDKTAMMLEQAMTAAKSRAE